MNPYKTPKSEFSVSVREGKSRHIGWKLYFWLCLVLHISYCLSLMYSPEFWEASLIDYIGGGIYSLVLIALFGFIYMKRFLTQRVWSIFFPLSVWWDIYAIFLAEDWSVIIEEWQTIPTVEGIILSGALAVMLSLFIPQYIALYRYGYREKALWNMRRS